MPLIGLNGDTCGGVVTASATKTTVEGKAPIRVGDNIAYHGTGPHAAAQMLTGSPTVFIEGKAVCRQGDAATCGHTLSASATKSFAG